MTGLTVTVDFVKATVSVGDRSWSIPPLLPAMQRLVAAGGAESLVRDELASLR